MWTVFDRKYVKLYSTKAQWVKPRMKSLYIDPYTFDIESFTNVILNNFKRGVSYSLLFKLKYTDNEGVQYGMASKQIPFKLTEVNNNNIIKNLYEDMVNLFGIFVDRYKVEDVELIQVIYIVTKDIPELKLKNVNKIKLNKEFLKVGDARDKFSSKSLPLTIDTRYYDKLLVSDNALLYLNKINEKYKFKKEDMNKLESIYLYKENYIIINDKINSSMYERRVYSANSGIFYFTAIDRIIDSYTFTRTIGKTTFTINDQEIVKTSSVKELVPIKYHGQLYKASSNPFIGTLDLETYNDRDGYAKVYALGFYTNKEVENNQQPITFYLENGMTSSELILKCIDNMLISKYNGYSFYVHNFGGFDAPFIINTLLTANANLGFEYYKLVYNLRDNKLLKLEIKVEIDNYTKKSGFYKIIIFDSYKLLSGSLYDLSRSFGLDTVKGYFPHKFVNVDTLNYKGNTPSIEYWKNISQDEYNEFYNNHWILKDECLKYLNKDLVSLYNIMDTFNKYVYRNYGVQMTDCLTISRLALNIFLKDYLKESKIPIINQSIYNDIKKAYFGGLTEVYKPYGKNLYYYDVNSLYPFVALNPMPGVNCTYTEYLNPEYYNKELFGFYYCEVETKDNYLGLLPIHNKFELIMPNGKWKGWYFSEELKLAVNNGYKIKVIKGYTFNKEMNVFDEYVKDLYKTKSVSTGSIRTIVKSLLNNLLGRFGINIKKPVTEIVNDDKLNLLLSTREVIAPPINVTDQDYLVTYFPGLSKYMCEAHDLDYIKILNIKSNVDIEKNQEFKDASVAIAAAITSYARIYMSNIKLNIFNSGGSIYYMDTDSIVTDKPLREDLVGKDLGQFKLEFNVKEGYFISSKTYCLVLKDRCGIYDLNNNLQKEFKNSTELAEHLGISEETVNKFLDKELVYKNLYRFKTIVIIKTKGLFSDSLSVKDFINMYNGYNVEGIKQNTVTNYEKGSVIIGEKGVTLNYNAFKKREKIYKNNKWVDTRPLSYNNLSSLSNSRGNRNYTNISYIQYCTCKQSFVVIETKYSKLIKFLSKNFKYLLILSLILLLPLLYIYVPYLIDMCNDIYNNYIMELHRIKGERIKFILENRLTNYSKGVDITYSYNNKINKFIDLNIEWRKESESLSKLNIVQTIFNELNVNFHILTGFFNTPTPQVTPNPNSNFINSTIVQYLFEAHTHTNTNMSIDVNNPLGIQNVQGVQNEQIVQGLQYQINETITMLNSYLAEHKIHNAEIENKSNILLTLVKDLKSGSN